MIATAKPTPRTMFAATAVRPLPPGRWSGSPSSPPTGVAGIGNAAVSRMQRSTGATFATVWPVISLSPVRIALRNRISTASMPQASARRSIWLS